MYSKRLILTFFICAFVQSICISQEKMDEETVEAHSLQLYFEGNWNDLLKYGKEAIDSGTDYSMVRMRMGYAAFMLGNYSQSLKNYQFVYLTEPNNNTALYYCYLNNLYLNNMAAARFYGSKLDEETRNVEGLKSVKIAELGLEYSTKSTNTIDRENAQYALFNINVQLGYNLELQQGIGTYNQIISEPQFLNVTNNDKIDISQKEYFAKLIYTPSSNINIIGGFHYVYTPFNNFEYNNTALFGGLSYTTPFVHFQGMLHSANITDVDYNQFDVSLKTFPLGNFNLYTISKGMFGDDAVFLQVIGAKVVRNVWLEGNITVGEYETLIDNDGLYLINDIDTKKSKIGASVYLFLKNKFLLSVNYNLEQKQKYLTTNNFNQNSTTINLKWKP